MRRVGVFFVVENVESIVIELLNGPVLRHDLAVGMLLYSPLL